MPQKAPFPFRTTKLDSPMGGAPLPAPWVEPWIPDFRKLAEHNLTTIAATAQYFLSDRYRITRTAKLKTIPDPGNRPYPAIFLLGNPYRIPNSVRHDFKDADDNRYVVVAEVLNDRVPGWRGLPEAATRAFTAESTAEGFYRDGDSGKQYVILRDSQARSIFNGGTALSGAEGIFLNTHQSGFSSALFHEILHIFETNDNFFSASNFFVEGFVEYFSRLFAGWCIDPRAPVDARCAVYGPYEGCEAEVAKLARQTGEQNCAKAFFDDDRSSLEQLLPMFDARIREGVAPENRLSDDALRHALSHAADSWHVRRIREQINPQVWIPPREAPPYYWRTPPAWYGSWRAWPAYAEVVAPNIAPLREEAPLERHPPDARRSEALS